MYRQRTQVDSECATTECATEMMMMTEVYKRKLIAAAATAVLLADTSVR